MTVIAQKTATYPHSPYPDCSPFLNWDEEDPGSEVEKAVVFRSLVATVKSHSSFEVSLETKAVKLIESVDPLYAEAADAFLCSLGRTTDDSLTDFVQSILALISSSNRAIVKATMTMLGNLIPRISAKVRLALIKADLIPQLVNTLNPMTLSFAEAVDIHTNLMRIIWKSLSLATPNGLEIRDPSGRPAVHETILQQVVAPSEKYIWHLCVNRLSIVNGDKSIFFLYLLTQLLQISPHNQPTMDLVLNMPVILTIPSCLTLFEDDYSVWLFMSSMVDTQREWNKQRGEVRQKWKTVHRMLRMEGIEDAIEEKLRDDKNGHYGRWLVAYLIRWINLHGLNLP
ncbi:hypothetical protein BLNAU_18556 [Blattamonas nauphoetae]|uniref:Uncharacterized protein n=1 Tax=Blattamonas nauphoetae TaxID=2049346 RepID=A0ABQ9X418_9EUKA|nr:hypothetical protein BLNAU_18556 [Blattamonas nauphoetae]